MRRISMILGILFLFAFGCKKDNLSPLKSKNISIISGDKQRGFFNVELGDSIILQVTDEAGEPLYGEKVEHEFLYETMGGALRFPDPIGSFTDSDGLVFCEWTVSCYEKEQTLMFYIEDSSLNMIDSVIIKAQVSDPIGWAAACGINEFCTLADRNILARHDNVFYASCHDKVYRSQDGGQEWELSISTPELKYYSSFFDIQFSKEGWMYLVTTESGIHFSKNQVTWEDIGQINRHYTGNWLVGFLREDSFLYASYHEEGLKRSSDNGQTWENLPIHTHSIEVYKFINRHPNGDLYLFDQWNILWKSIDNGDSWEPIILDDKYVNTRVEDFIIGEDGLLYVGAGDASFSILSPDTYEGELRQFYVPNNEEQYVNNIQIIDNVIHFNVVGNTESGIHSSENWERLDIDFNKPVFSYLLKEDGHFLIRSDFRIYHYF